MAFKKTLIGSCLVFLAACSTLEFQEQHITVKNWSVEEQAQMANDISRLPNNSILIPAMEDYARMRAEARAASAAK